MKLIFTLYQVGVYIMQSIIIPIEIVRRKDIGSTSKFVYGYLESYFQENNSFPTIKEIADDLKRSFQAVSLAIKELREFKIIDTVKRGTKNIYKFLLKDTLYKPPVDTLYKPPVDTLYKPPVDTLYKPPVDTLYKPPVDTSLDASVSNINKGFISEDKLVNVDMNKVFTSEDKLVDDNINKGFISEAPKKRKIRIVDLDNLPCFKKNVPDMNKVFTSEDKLVDDVKPSKNIEMNKGFISKDNELDHIEYGDPEFLETSICNHQYTSKTLYKNCPKEHENFKSVFESAAMLGMPKSLNNKLNDALLNFGLEYVKWTLELILFSTQREKIAEALVFNWRTINPDYSGSIVRTNL